MDTAQIRQVILTMATARGADKSICPSEVARHMFDDNWRAQMPTVRTAAFDLAGANQVIIMQKNIEVDPQQVKGPIRIKIKPAT